MRRRLTYAVAALGVAAIAALFVLRGGAISTDGFDRVELAAAQLTLAPAFDFYELRRGWPGRSLEAEPIELLVGEPCSSAADRPDCLRTYDRLVAEGGPSITTGCAMCPEWFLLQGLGNEMSYVGPGRATEFFGTIDTPHEAALMAAGASWVKPDGDGFLLIRREFVEVCDPIVEAVLLLRVTSEGAKSVVRRETITTPGECI